MTHPVRMCRRRREVSQQNRGGTVKICRRGPVCRDLVSAKTRARVWALKISIRLIYCCDDRRMFVALAGDRRVEEGNERGRLCWVLGGLCSRIDYISHFGALLQHHPLPRISPDFALELLGDDKST